MIFGMKAPFIVLDGPDGSGTTLHSKLLAERFQAEGKEVLLTAEPTDGPIGSWIREQLKSGTQIPAAAIQLAFTADRAWHMEHVVLPALSAGKIVICDRYSYSTIAYGKALGLDEDWLTQMNAIFLKPDVTIFALPSIDVCMERLSRRSFNDSFEKRDLQEKVHAAYKMLAASDASIAIVDTEGEKPDIAAKIWEIVSVRGEE